jgi:hypothetical protein
VAVNKITLQLESRPVEASIVKTFEPRTQSCAMVLSFDSNLSALGIEGNVVLKVYDRRFSTGLRKLWKAAPVCTSRMDKRLHKYLCSEEGKEWASDRQRFRIHDREEECGFIPTICCEDASEGVENSQQEDIGEQ